MIETQDLTKHYGRHEALHGLTLSIPAGSACVLLGENGAGKSTTLRLLVNLIRPSRGSSRLLGVDSRALRPQHWRQIGYVAENQDLPSGLSVASYFDYLRPLYGAAWDRGFESSLRASLGLPDTQTIGALSRGMRMKLQLASTLAFRPRLLILDEPLTGLDVLVRDELLSTLARQLSDVTMLVSTHDVADVEGLVTDVAFLRAGSLRFHRPLAELTQSYRRIQVYRNGADAVADSGTSSANFRATGATAPPPQWVRWSALGKVVSFIDTEFDEAATKAHLHRVFGPQLRFEVEPLDLRTIFIAAAYRDRPTAPNPGFVSYAP